MTDVAAKPRSAHLTAIVLVIGLLVAAVALIVGGGPADIINKTVPKNDVDGQVQPFINMIEALKQPLNLALVTVVPLGATVGAGMVACGSRRGPQVVVSSLAAGAVVVLGNGLIF
jgi:hypothetical protein